MANAGAANDLYPRGLLMGSRVQSTTQRYIDGDSEARKRVVDLV